MNKTGAGLAKWAEDIIAGGQHVYWYGTYCNPCTASLLKGKTQQYSTHYKDSRQATYKKHIEQGKTCTDCVGLIKGYYWELDGVIKYKRDGLPDKGAKGMYNAAKVKGKIADGMPEIPGILVWTQTQGHVGVYVGDGMVVEARGFAYGVQRNALAKRAFTHWGLCPYVTYTEDEQTLAIETAGSATDDTRPTLRKGSKGAAVMELQGLLLKAGCTLPEYGADGTYGTETVEAVKAFQATNALTSDGICGPLTWAKLDAVTGSTGATSSSTTQAPTSTRPTLRKGDKGDAVQELQGLLLKAGCTLPQYGADGSYGSETVAAVKAYQTANALTPDGICGPLTWAKLDAAAG